MKRVLLLGGSGLIGTALRAALEGIAVDAPTHAEFDIVSGDPVPLFDRADYDTAINCAAFHNVDACEREPDKAFAGNALAVDRLARASAERGMAFVTFTTDYVFDGDANRPYIESDPTEPRTVYGISKVAGELLARRAGPKYFIIRTSGVFGAGGTSSKGLPLIDRVLGQAERGEPTRMVSDMTFSPSYAPHVARAVVALLEAKAYGTHHIVNAGSCTWYTFVQAAFARAGFADAPLEAVTYASFNNPVQRPLYAPLENTTLAALGIPGLPRWDKALDEYFTARVQPAK
jgi:dTDP-4-dehydrorhamnose reductase